MQVGKGEGGSRSAAPTVGAIAIVVVVGLATACAGGEQGPRLDPSVTVTLTTEATTLAPTTEVATTLAPTTEVATTVPTGPLNLGDGARVGDLEVTVRQTRLADAINSGIQVGSFLLVDVTIHNAGAHDESYGPLDWRLVLEDGTAVEPEVYADEGKLAFGTLGPGQSVDGALAFALAGPVPATLTYARSTAPDAKAEWAVTPAPSPGA